MALKGTFQDISLKDLLIFCHIRSHSGILLLINDKKRAMIYIANGTIIDAAMVCSCDRCVLASGEEAVIEAFDWKQAQFMFRPDNTVHAHPVRIQHDLHWIEQESKQRAARTACAQSTTIDLDTELQLSPLPPEHTDTTVTVDLIQWRILSQVESCRNLRAVCQATGIEPEIAIPAATKLCRMGIITSLGKISSVRASTPEQRYRQTAAA
ncbi:MAG: DUF4388 domain-containing protein [Chloroflexaceae bacterium]|nr:DUF4388 domain-containing protein [Chloroflexaceae bacterium]